MTPRSEVAVQVLSRDIHVLHVDDDRAFAELNVEMLEREEDDINAIAETRPRDAVDRVVDENIDCIVSDYEMPEMDGIELLQTIRERYPDLPFILFTGKGSEEVASEAFSAGASDYLQKEHGTDQYTLLANRIVSAIENVRSQQKQRHQLRAIETAKEGIAIFSPEGCCTYANQRYADIYGYKPEQLLGKHWEEFYPPEEVGYVREEVMSILDEEGYWHGRMINIGSDGIPFEIDHSVATTEEGGMVCTIREISKPDDVERELTKFKTIVETLNDPVYMCDDDGRFQYVNDALLDLVGYSRDRVIGAYPGLIKSDESVDVAEDNLAHLLSSENADSVVFEVEI